MSAIQKILIANRGEIACRVIRTCRAMGIASVAVYSEADRHAEHVRLADEAVFIGPSEAIHSYLNPEEVLAAAQQTGADAIHPGYGFLSENAEFAERVEAAGLVFIGPRAASMRAMGSKAGAKTLMIAHGVPVIPGYSGELQEPAHLQQEAERVGYPLMIKAAHGGGGKGMRVVLRAEDFLSALESCQREARGAFGKDRVLLERYIEKPRHIEFQIFADKHGNTLHLGERECSAQRRFQKILEESPSPFLTPALRQRMAEAAVQAARAVDYLNAGTVEFIVAQDGEFFFMEINARLQVEHPVTEMVTGLDLVRWQIEVAAGKPMPLAQDQITATGHAIEVRLYAEDPSKNFMPGSGIIRQLHLPEAGHGVRIDGGFFAGDSVSVFYDPMLAKLIVHAESREAALQAMQKALAQCQIFGLPSNIEFLERLISHPAVVNAEIDTGFLDKHLDSVLPHDSAVPGSHVLAAAYLCLKQAMVPVPAPQDPWSADDFWRPAGTGFFRCRLKHGETIQTYRVRRVGGLLEVLGAEGVLRAQVLYEQDNRLGLDIEGRHAFMHHFDFGVQTVIHDGKRRSLWLRQRPGDESRDSASRSDGYLRAPMPGKVVVVKVAKGQTVAKGEEVAVMEAMKMELSIKAPEAGRILDILTQAGQVLDADAALLQWEPGND